MVHFPGLALAALCVQAGVTGYNPAGFPHSEISESRVVCTSSELIAAYHVLHRLHAPRHPPCALSSLTIKFAHHKLALVKTTTRTRSAHQITPSTFRSPKPAVKAARLVPRRSSPARSSEKDSLSLTFWEFCLFDYQRSLMLKVSFAVASLLMRRTFIYYKKGPGPVKTGSSSQFYDTRR